MVCLLFVHGYTWGPSALNSSQAWLLFVPTQAPIAHMLAISKSCEGSKGWFIKQDNGSAMCGMRWEYAKCDVMSVSVQPFLASMEGMFANLFARVNAIIQHLRNIAFVSILNGRKVTVCLDMYSFYVENAR